MPPAACPGGLWYLALTFLLGTLYSRTYTEESAASAYVRVALLLAVVFATAIGVGTLVGSLSPTAGRIVLMGLVIALLTFVAYKLGDRIGTILELLTAFALRGHWYLMPLVVVLLLTVAASSSWPRPRPRGAVHLHPLLSACPGRRRAKPQCAFLRE